ncbi:MAG: aminotransferase class I/II-fold pyridoxal phosphate-dependent enzyme [Ruminococcaceae bacterium]|nr:aminotransferase class I/II-fold pyridoxal phosphate-dependent enzyme [Oscillospiraceae bacterium]
MNYLNATKAEKNALYGTLRAEYDALAAQGLSLDLSRGKPSGEQLGESMPMLGENCTLRYLSENGFDCRNYGVLEGLPEMRAFWSELTGIPAKNIVVGGNSSLNLMYDTLSRAMLYGVAGSPRPWCREEKVKFICLTPGYDRHFAICESLGIEMISVPLLSDGPDMDKVEALVAADASIKGMWCVPKYSNPSGITYSDEAVRRLARMKTAAPDFRIFWDNAYMVHDIENEGDALLDLFAEAHLVGNGDRVFFFSSTSKITFPGAGIAMMAMSDANLSLALSVLTVQTIGYDKMNQIRHLAFLPDKAAVEAHMKKQARYLKERFSIVLDTLKRDLGDTGVAKWTAPRGGYFVSLDVLPHTAKRVYALCKEAGVTLTKVGATFPYGVDPEDKNLRLAPSYPKTEDLALAMRVLTLAVRLAALESLLA